MTARDHLPAHLVAAGELHGDFGRLTIGTPASPEKRLCRHGDPQCPCQDGDMCHYEGPDPMAPPAIIDIRPAGERGFDLLVKHAGQQLVVPLSWGHLSNLAADAVAAMIRMGEAKL